MRTFTVKYVSNDKRTGHYVYRRRVPAALAEVIQKREFLKVLGRTEAEALSQYSRYNEHIEHLIALAKHGVVGLSEAQQRAQLIALFEEWGADPFGPGQSENERSWREVAAERLVGPHQNPRTGHYEGVPKSKEVMANALLGGMNKEAPEPTLRDAFEFYLEENKKPIPEQRKKQEQRLKRAEKNLIAVIGEDLRVSEITRAHARSWRKMRETQGVTTSTIRREKNDISAVINLANSELDAGSSNPFVGLKLAKATTSRLKERFPLPQEVIDGVYGELSKNKSLLQIWTLMDFTGARPGEIRMLKSDEIVLDCDVPHIEVRERDDRTLKTLWSVRKIPVIKGALTVCQELLKGAASNDYVFPKYASEGGLDRLSSALSRRVRKFTKDPKHVPYSLRHNMRDRMRRAEVSIEVSNAIDGRAYSSGEDASYGGEISLEQKQDALEKALTGYPRRPQ
ncbi:MAG: integrase [Cognatishimia sp.]|uniref:integrase n=1 Tax=Cognatishimia sp. TaxID=2211648 RepID=UPI003B8E4CB5